MMLKPCPTRLDAFLWMRGENRLVAEASDLLAVRGGFGRVWDDAADEGLTVVSPSGRSVVYVVAHHERRDGEVLWIDLHPVVAYEDLPTVRIFND